MRILLPIVVIVCMSADIAIAQQNLGEPFVFENQAGRTMPYRLFTPPGADAGGQFPLVVFLHGAGESGTDNQLQVAVHINGLIEATQSEEFAAYLLAPQVPDANLGWSADGLTDLGIEIIDSLTESLPIDTSRVYVTGLSMGGIGSFNYISQHPNTFAAAVPMSGGFNPSTADSIKDVPVWSFHGDRDNTVSPEGSRRMYQAITNAGGTTYLTELVGASHVIWAPIYSDASRDTYGLYEWLFSQTLDRRTPSAIIEFGSEWAFLDDGGDQGDAWRTADFDDASWQRGVAPLGFGYGNETTTLSCGPIEDCDTEMHATFYFRRTFNVDDPTQIENVIAQIERDDGVIVHVNGNEVFRDSNIRSTTSFDTFARTEALNNGLTAFRIDDAIVPGVNTLAVELHQAARGTTDLRFDLRLTAVRVPEPSASALLLFGLFAIWMSRDRSAQATRLR